MRESKYSQIVKDERNKELFAKYKTGFYPLEKLAGIYNMSVAGIWKIVKKCEEQEENDQALDKSEK